MNDKLEDYQNIYFNPDIVKGKTCPKCGSNDILVDPEEYQQEIILGGCVCGNDSPNVVCRACEYSWIVGE